MTLASFPMTSISSKAHKIDFSYFLFTVDATFLYYVQSRNLAEKISIPAELVVPVRVTQTLFRLFLFTDCFFYISSQCLDIFIIIDFVREKCTKVENKFPNTLFK